MKILFTLLSIEKNNKSYLKACENLSNELLTNTPYDILITTNNPEYFKETLQSTRVLIRKPNLENLVLSYENEFNFNLKFLCFENIPENYDAVFYLDCDIKSIFWKTESSEYLNTSLQEHDLIATRLNCTLKDQVEEFLEKGTCLFSHKIKSYNVLDWKNLTTLYESRLPSEHLVILRNDKNKLNFFVEKWKELNFQMQQNKGGYGCWGDGFEMGISAYHAGFKNWLDLNYSLQECLLGFEFNGNKFLKYE